MSVFKNWDVPMYQAAIRICYKSIRTYALRMENLRKDLGLAKQRVAEVYVELDDERKRGDKMSSVIDELVTANQEYVTALAKKGEAIKLLVGLNAKQERELIALHQSHINQYNDLQQRISNLKMTAGKHEFLTEAEIKQLVANELVDPNPEGDPVKDEIDELRKAYTEGEPEKFVYWLWREGYDEGQLQHGQLLKLAKQAWPKMEGGEKFWAVDLKGERVLITEVLTGNLVWQEWSGKQYTAGIHDILNFPLTQGEA